MHEISNMGTIAHVIQLSIAPVFLLTAICTLLTVTTNRLGRIAMTGGHITAIGGEELLDTATDKTKRIDLRGRRVIPGLNDSHIARQILTTQSVISHQLKLRLRIAADMNTQRTLGTNTFTKKASTW